MNPNVKPRYGMVDFDTAETINMEAVFPEIDISLCDFHREQP